MQEEVGAVLLQKYAANCWFALAYVVVALLLVTMLVVLMMTHLYFLV
jgi:hypothetical protein